MTYNNDSLPHYTCSFTQPTATGIAPPGVGSGTSHLPVTGTTRKEYIDKWFIDPLMRLGGDDGFVCLMLCFPLIETILRYELMIPDEDDVKFSDGAPALKKFARLLSIPESEARATWNAFRNGLMHRSMVSAADFSYELNPKMPGRNAEFKDGVIIIYVWQLRDWVVGELRRLHGKLWKDSSSPLPGVYVKEVQR